MARSPLSITSSAWDSAWALSTQLSLYKLSRTDCYTLFRTRIRFATPLISSRLNHPRSFQTGVVPSPYSARYIEYFCGLDNPESLGCHGPLTPGNSHTHDAVGADREQRATRPIGPLSPQAHEWSVAKEVLFAPKRTHTAMQDRAAAVPAVVAAAAPAAGVSRHVLA